MPSIKRSSKEPLLDMNPMVDMAFLLVCFFMMTTTFKTELPVQIALPISSAELKIPDQNICTINVGEDGSIFIGIDNKYDRKQMLDFVARKQGAQFSADQTERFSLLSSFGVPFSELTEYLSLDKQDREDYPQSGIPYDTVSNELQSWVIASRMANPQLRYAINGDKNVSSTHIKRLFDILQDLNITRFNLITDSKTGDTKSR
jgi:biopolymer transport protein ExbD